MPDAVYLLPPSEAKAPGGTRGTRLAAQWKREGAHAFPALEEPRRAVSEALARFCEEGSEAARAKAFKVSGANLEAATAANAHVLDAPTLPATKRYTGVLHEHLNAATLGTSARRRLHRHGIVLSGLLGLVAPTDPVPAYKLPMDASLPGLGRLATWWRPRLSPVLDDRVAGRVVWDLLPGVHRAAWAPHPDRPAKRVLTARFVEVAGARETTVSHWNKALKGALVRHLLETDGSAAAAESFVHEGYAFDPARSEGDALVFSRRA